MAETSSSPRQLSGSRPAIQPAERETPHALIYIMVFSMLLPIRFTLIGAELFPLRLLVLIMLLPFLMQLMNGTLGRFRNIDGFMIAFSVWMFLSLLANEGISRLPLAVVTVVDFFGGYLIGRALIRSAEDFKVFMKAMVIAALVMLPFALIEFITNFNGLQKIFSPVFDTFRKGRTSYGRLGFERVMAGFAHPILYGFFCSLTVATIYFTYRPNFKKAVMLTGFFVFMTFMSLSSAPLLSAAVQLGLIGWGWITKGAWKLLAWMTAVGYVVVDLLSNRTPITILINYVTFNSDTAWYRVAQWKFGSASVQRNPLFGIGLGEWARPGWLSSSVDNFWLLMAMRHGLPSLIFLVLALFFLLRSLVRLQDLPEEAARIRLGYVLTLLGALLTLATVHVWGAAGIFLMAFFGMGVWLLDVPPTVPGHAPETDQPDAPAETAEHAPRARPVRRDRRALPMTGRIRSGQGRDR